MRKRSEVLSLAIGALLGTVLAVYAVGQQELNAKEHKDDLKPVVEVRAVEFQEVQPEEIQEEAPEYISLGEFKLTAYCSCERCCGRWAKNRPVDEEGNQIVIGASGEVLEAGISIAVDKNVIPYGSTVLIDGQAYVAHDCGGAIKKNRIDVYFSDHQDALEFGVQYAEVFLMKGGEIDG